MTRKEKLESEIRNKDHEVSELKKRLKDDEAVSFATSEFSHHWTYDVELVSVSPEEERTTDVGGFASTFASYVKKERADTPRGQLF